MSGRSSEDLKGRLVRVVRACVGDERVEEAYLEFAVELLRRLRRSSRPAGPDVAGRLEECWASRGLALPLLRRVRAGVGRLLGPGEVEACHG